MTDRERLDKLRGEIDALDQDIVDLFLRRLEVSGKIADVKKAGNIAITDPGREAVVLDSAVKAALARDPESGAEVTALMRLILELSKQRQRRRLSAGPEPEST